MSAAVTDTGWIEHATATLARAGFRRGGARSAVVELLEELGLVTRLEVGQGVARYEPAHPSGDHHHHLVCERCGAIAPFEDRALERAITRLAGRLAFDVDDHEVVLRGACRACRD